MGALALLLGAAGVGVAIEHAGRRVEVGTEARRLLPNGRRIVVRQFRGPEDTLAYELQLRSADLGVVWSVPFDLGRSESILCADGAVFYQQDEALVVRELADGSLRWTTLLRHPWESRPSLEVREFDHDLIEILRPQYGPGALVRRRSLVTGALEWSAGPLVVPQHPALHFRWHDGVLFFDAGRTVSRIELDSGLVELLSPIDALTTCFTEREVLFVDSEWHLWLRPHGETAREVGRLPPGRLECARADGRIWLEWGEPHVLRHAEPFEPAQELRSTTGVAVGERADGAVFVLDGGGELVWGVQSAWGAPRFGIVRLSRGGRAFVVPRPRPGQLVLRFIEATSGGEEVGVEGGRAADLVVAEATGLLL